ncbi:hypothetical protein OWM07_04965 [Deferribacter thermophilus]|uniref:TraR/DksA C4-type zinc finger protein n=1 Tax=Deferribacter thermophilus TaxID=53573 RepID=UPI003C248460
MAAPVFKRPFTLKLEDIVEIEGPFDFNVPKGKSCFNLVICESCGDAVAENYVKIVDGKKVCPDRFPY